MRSLKYIIIAVFSLLISSVCVSAEPKVPLAHKAGEGWTEIKSNGYEIVNTGNRGGKLTLGCSTYSGIVSMSYVPKDKGPTELFLLELPGLAGAPDKVTVSAFGLSTLPAGLVLERMQYSVQGIIASYYGINAVHQFFQSRANPEETPVPVPVGWERFPGNHNVINYLDRMRTHCNVSSNTPYL